RIHDPLGDLRGVGTRGGPPATLHRGALPRGPLRPKDRPRFLPLLTRRRSRRGKPEPKAEVTTEGASAVALEVAGTRDPQLVGDRRQKMRERALGNVARADAQRELAVEVARASTELLDIVWERVRVAEQPRERTDLSPHQRRSERDLALEDAEAVRGDERSEPKPRIVDPGEHLCLDELAHSLGELRGVRAILHQPARSRRCSSSNSISAASRPSTASSTLRCCPERWRRDWVSAPMAHFILPTI